MFKLAVKHLFTNHLKIFIMKKSFLLFAFSLLVSLTSIQAQDWTQIGIGIGGEESNDYFGWSASLSADGSIVAIGAPGNNYVRVFQNNSGTWIQIGADIEVAENVFGGSVSLSSDGATVAIGAIGDDGNVYVRMYQNNSGTWTQIGEDIEGGIAGPGAVDEGIGATVSYGYSVSLSADGSIVAIGATGDFQNGVNSGHVRVFQNSSGTWTQIGTDINGEAAGDESGNSVSLSADGSIVAIGAYKNTGNGMESGHVRIYKNNSGIWTQIGTDIDGEVADDWSGFSVSLSSDGSIVAIGAPNNDGNGNDAGHVRVYQNISGVWSQEGDEIEGESAYSKSGFSVCLSSNGSVVAIGAPTANVYKGQVRVYQNNSDVWTAIGTSINEEDSFAVLGFYVSLSSNGSIVAVGTPGKNSGTGQIEIYENEFVGISELEELGILIYPNPSTGAFSIENADDYEITISDVTGKMIYHGTSGQVYLQTNGMYIINFKSKTRYFSSKIIIE